MQRRNFLKSSLGLAGATSSAGLLSALMSQPASAATEDYRALVCIFLYGGNDGMNMIVPTDTTRYNAYAAVRQKLAIPQNSLISIGNNLGLHPALAGLGEVLTDNKLATLLNVGPLAEPITRDEAAKRLKALPDSLFSHSDQQMLWECGGPSTLTSEGWGGLMAQKNSNIVVSVSGNHRFGLTKLQGNLALPGAPGSFVLPGWYGNATNLTRKTALVDLSKQANNNKLMQHFNGVRSLAFERSDTLSPILVKTPSDSSEVVNAAFAGLWDTATKRFASPIAAQLYQIAKLIAHRTEVKGSRQVYFAAQGGFDTHAGQVNDGDSTVGAHANLLKSLADALGAFYKATKALGLADNVVSFTASDFGRTLKPNTSLGTDHAWGNNQLIIGGGVKPGAYGTYPTLTLGAGDDIGNEGRWIPTTAVDQYAATLGSWFGLSASDLANVLPNLAKFSTKNLGFLQTLS